jgi:hypothetical protein
MIIAATETDGQQIQNIAARAGVFSQEEVDCVVALWEEYLSVGPVEGGYNFLVDREEERSWASPATVRVISPAVSLTCTGLRSIPKRTAMVSVADC